MSTTNGTNNGNGNIGEAEPEIEVRAGFYCRDEGRSLRVIRPVSGKPGYWWVQTSVMSYGFRNRGSGQKPPTEMSEEELIELYLAHRADDAAKTLNTVGFGPNAKVRKLRDTKLFTKENAGVSFQKIKSSRKNLIHAALQRLKMQTASEQATV